MARHRVYDAADIEIGKRVRCRRLALGLSQIQVAESMGITPQQLAKYESGQNRIMGARFKELGDALQINPSFFFMDDDTVEEPQGGELLIMMRAFKVMPPDMRATFLCLAAAVVENTPENAKMPRPGENPAGAEV